MKISAPENREEREQQAKHNAHDDAGHDGKIERGMFALDANVTRQSAQPFWREAAPHQQPYQHDNQTDDYEDFSKFAHDSKSCANQPKEQA